MRFHVYAWSRALASTGYLPREVIAMKFACALVAVLIVVPVTAKAGAKKKKPEGIRGVVTKIDSTAKTFTFRTGKKKDANPAEETVRFNDQTVFQKLDNEGVADAKSGDLAVRTRVAVVYESKDGKNIATKITILPKPAKK
jgi:hypothetical protein